MMVHESMAFRGGEDYEQAEEPYKCGVCGKPLSWTEFELEEWVCPDGHVNIIQEANPYREEPTHDE
jgi:hypothetical protein